MDPDNRKKNRKYDEELLTPSNVGTDGESESCEGDDSTKILYGRRKSNLSSGNEAMDIYTRHISCKLKHPQLEEAYQRYAGRQRFKALIIVNITHIFINLIMYFKSRKNKECWHKKEDVKCWFYTISFFICIIFNSLLIFVSWRKNYANDYLKFKGLITWSLLLFQVNSFIF